MGNTILRQAAIRIELLDIIKRRPFTKEHASRGLSLIRELQQLKRLPLPTKHPGWALYKNPNMTIAAM